MYLSFQQNYVRIKRHLARVGIVNVLCTRALRTIATVGVDILTVRTFTTGMGQSALFAQLAHAFSL